VEKAATPLSFLNLIDSTAILHRAAGGIQSTL
jgi:hypothetical protein